MKPTPWPQATKHHSPLVRTITAVLLALCGMVGLVHFAEPAAAANPTYQTTDDVSLRTRPTAAPTGVYGIPRGASFTVSCQVEGEGVGPRGNRLYFLTSYAGKQMYVPDYYTNSPHLAAQPPIAGIPMCGSASPGPIQGSSPCLQGSCGSPAPAPATAASKAISWARTQLGLAIADPATTRYYPSSEWRPGPDGEWSGDCLRFVAHAYRITGGPAVSTSGGTAAGSYRAYANAGRIRQGTPPAGAIVFWHGINHVALSIGGGQVIGTVGAEHARQPVSIYSTTYNGVPMSGWAMP